MRNFSGSNLRLARLFHGLSLAELGEKVSTSRQFIQKVESNLAPPPADLVPALAELLKVKVDFFYNTEVNMLPDEACNFRKQKTTPIHLTKRAQAYGTFFNIIIDKFEHIAKLPNVDLPLDIPPALDFSINENIEKTAETCRIHWGLGIDAPVRNLTRVLERAGFIIVTFNDISNKIDAFSYMRNRPIIVHNIEKDCRSRGRFDLAHECGHIIMHRDVEHDDVELENQANRFASAFLLPRVAFVREFQGPPINWRHVFNLKARWGVSVQAIIRRAYDLHIINSTQYRNANVYISKNHWKKNEPAEDKIELEVTEVLPKVFHLLSEKRGITPSMIAEELNMSCEIIQKFNLECNEPQVHSASNIYSFESYRRTRNK